MAPPIQPRQNTESLAGLRRNPPRKARRVTILDINGSDSEDMKRPVKPHFRKRSLRKPRPFRFLNLPAELRNMVYGYLLINNRCKNDPVFSAPEIKKGIRKRVAINRRRQTLSKKREEEGKKSVQRRAPTTEPLAYISILSACKQIHDEAKDILYRKNSFRIAIRNFKWDNNPEYMQLDCGLYGWDFPRITNLQLELSIDWHADLATRVNWVGLTKAMPALRRLQVFVTLPDPSRWGRSELSDWGQVDWKYKAIFRDLVAAIPKSVNVKWGLTLRQKVRDFKDKDYVEGRVLRAMYREFENQQGIDLETPGATEGNEDDAESVVDPNTDYSGVFDED